MNYSVLIPESVAIAIRSTGLEAIVMPFSNGVFLTCMDVISPIIAALRRTVAPNYHTVDQTSYQGFSFMFGPGIDKGFVDSISNETFKHGDAYRRFQAEDVTDAVVARLNESIANTCWRLTVVGEDLRPCNDRSAAAAGATPVPATDADQIMADVHAPIPAFGVDTGDDADDDLGRLFAEDGGDDDDDDYDGAGETVAPVVAAAPGVIAPEAVEPELTEAEAIVIDRQETDVLKILAIATATRFNWETRTTGAGRMYVFFTGQHVDRIHEEFIDMVPEHMVPVYHGASEGMRSVTEGVSQARARGDVVPDIFGVCRVSPTEVVSVKRSGRTLMFGVSTDATRVVDCAKLTEDKSFETIGDPVTGAWRAIHFTKHNTVMFAANDMQFLDTHKHRQVILRNMMDQCVGMRSPVDIYNEIDNLCYAATEDRDSTLNKVYSKHLNNRFGTTLEKEVERAEARVRDLQMQLTEARKAFAVCVSDLEAYRSKGEGNAATKMRAECSKLDQSGITKVVFGEDGIMAFTNNVTVVDPENEKVRYQLGRFIISFPYGITNAQSISITNAQQVIGEGRSFRGALQDACHVYSNNGYTCLGNSETDLNKAIKGHDLIDIVFIMRQFLENANVNDPAGKILYKFPKVGDKDVAKIGGVASYDAPKLSDIVCLPGLAVNRRG